MKTDRRTQTNSNAPNQEERLPPHDLNAEAALIGASLFSPIALEVLATRTEPIDYYKPAHASIVKVMQQEFEQGRPVDPVTVADQLNRMGELKAIGGPVTLIELQASGGTVSSAGRYAQIIHDHATLRRTIAASRKVIDLAMSGPFDVHDTVEEAQSLFAGVASQNGARTYSTLEIPDMGSLVTGDIDMPEPTILTRNDGKCLIYPGMIHVFQAEPSVGKSWIALHCATEVLAMGGAVVYLDFEDHPRSIIGRLLALGALPDDIKERFQYIRPTGGIGISERAEMSTIFQRLRPDLVILDGVAESLSRDGFDEDRNADVIKWTDQLPRWITKTGAACLLLDHVTKNKEQRGRHARGAGAKLAVPDGVAYQVVLQSGFSRHRAGAIKLIVAKDRPGAVGEVGSTVAVLKVRPASNGEVVRISVEPPPDPKDANFRPTRTMERISIELENLKNPIGPKLLIDVVTGGGRRNLVEDAFNRLRVDNYVDTYKMGKTTLVRLLKPYRQGDAPLPPPAIQEIMEEIAEVSEMPLRRPGSEHD